MVQTFNEYQTVSFIYIQIFGSVDTVILIPGLGLIAWGKKKSESRVTAEFFSLAIEVMRTSEAIN